MNSQILQVRMEPEVIAEIEHYTDGSRSDFVRLAITEKLQREKNKLLEKKWIKALSKKSDRQLEDAAWNKLEQWGGP